jgi:hypothetical protein
MASFLLEPAQEQKTRPALSRTKNANRCPDTAMLSSEILSNGAIFLQVFRKITKYE